MKKVMMMMTALAVAALAGCQTADPASRSNKTRYRDIAARVQGNSNTVNITVGDGLYADASGGGDTQSNTPMQTTETKPEVAAAWGGASAGTGGAKPTSGLTEAAMAAWAKLTGGQKVTAEEAQAIKDCADGNCEP